MAILTEWRLRERERARERGREREREKKRKREREKERERKREREKESERERERELCTSGVSAAYSLSGLRCSQRRRIGAIQAAIAAAKGK
jgi:hypothetical protein